MDGQDRQDFGRWFAIPLMIFAMTDAAGDLRPANRKYVDCTAMLWEQFGEAAIAIRSRR